MSPHSRCCFLSASKWQKYPSSIDCAICPSFYCPRCSWPFLPRGVSTGPRPQWRTSLSSATSWGPIPSTHAEGGTSTVIRQGVRPGAALPLPGQGARDDADELVNTYSSRRSRSLSCHLTTWSPPLRLSWRSPSDVVRSHLLRRVHGCASYPVFWSFSRRFVRLLGAVKAVSSASRSSAWLWLPCSH
jgi:hypothetical protein